MKRSEWAEWLARKLLAGPLPRRWAHTQGVARRARSVAPILGESADLLEAAAWLHDIGYTPDLVDTGFHPLDGARYLSDAEGADELLCSLVAHHSNAIVEAEVRGMRTQLLAQFPRPPLWLANALAYCDMTTSPHGVPVTLEYRLAEVHERYGEGHPVSRSITRSTPYLIEAVTSIEQHMAMFSRSEPVSTRTCNAVLVGASNDPS